MLAGVARLNEMVDEVVPELAWQMGRPVRYGGEFRGFNERSNYVASIAADALAPIVVEDSASFERRIERVAHVAGAVAVDAYDGDQHGRAGVDQAGNAVILKHASQTILVGRARGPRLRRSRRSG